MTAPPRPDDGNGDGGPGDGDALPPDLAGLDAALTTHALGRRVVFRRETDSTMDVARALAAAGAPHGTLVLADHQRAGRGRQGRTWHDAPGAAVLASLVVHAPPGVPPSRLVVALAVGVADGLRALGVDARLKWPNDVRVAGRKVAGMIAATVGGVGGGAGRGRGAVVLGLGLNVRPESVPEDLALSATSVAEAVPVGTPPPTRADVLAAVLSAAEPWIDRAPSAALLDRYAALLDGLGQTVSLDTGAATGTPGARVTGTFEGVDADGALRLRGPDGVVRRHHAGDVHVVPSGA